MRRNVVLPALFRRYPRLRGRLAWTPLLRGPTPVEAVHLAGVAAPLWVKRDGRCAERYGGNKPRKLEWIIGQALARGARRLVTTGALGTHHGLATTVLGRGADLACTLVLVRRPWSAEVDRTLRLSASFGAELIYGGSVPVAALRTGQVLLRATLRGERPALVPSGGSSPGGCLGFVSAALELAEQIEAGQCPEPAHIFVPLGTGGTAVGLLIGCALAGLRCEVVPVLVNDILPPGPAQLASLARETTALLRRHDPSVPRLRLGRRHFRVVRGQLGEGYGHPTPQALEALRLARDAGISSETTYSAKCLAEVLRRATVEGLALERALFWETFSAVDLAPLAPVDPDQVALPAAVARLAC